MFLPRTFSIASSARVLIAGQGHFAVRRQDVDEVMGNPPPLSEIRFGDADVEPPIEIARVGVDNFSIEFHSQLNAESRLADGGRTSNDDDAWARFVPLRWQLTSGSFGCCSLPRNLL